MIVPAAGSLLTLALVVEPADLLVGSETLLTVAGADAAVSVFLLVDMVVASIAYDQRCFHIIPGTAPRVIDARSIVERHKFQCAWPRTYSRIRSGLLMKEGSALVRTTNVHPL